MRLTSAAGVAGLALGAALGATATGTAAAAPSGDDTVVVTQQGTTGDVTIPEYGPAFTTPTTFTRDESSIGGGSLLVEPIGAEPEDKFIGYVAYAGLPASELESLSFDFQLADATDADDVQDFYTNLYVITEPGQTFYNCRYDQVALTGSSEEFETLTVSADQPTTRVTTRQTETPCPPTIDGLPEGATINYAAINVGQSSAGDEATSGYLDNIVVQNAGGTTTYDLEKAPASKQDCQDGNTTGFKNQGECVSSFAGGSNSGQKG